MLIGDSLVGLLVLGFWLFCLFDVIVTDESLMRNLSKPWWVVIVLIFSVIGSIMWLVAGRPQAQRGPGLPYRGNRGDVPVAGHAGSSGRSRPSGALAPDDDPEFLDRVRRQNAEDKDLLARWEEDLRRREEQLRGGDPSGGASGDIAGDEGTSTAGN